MELEQNDSAIWSYSKNPFFHVDGSLTKRNIIFPPHPPAPVQLEYLTACSLTFSPIVATNIWLPPSPFPHLLICQNKVLPHNEHPCQKNLVNLSRWSISSVKCFSSNKWEISFLQPPVRFTHSTYADSIRPTWPDTSVHRFAKKW
jgi:hypothetical protein